MYEFYMDNLLLPIAPSKFTLKASNSNKTMELIKGGEINFLRSQGLSELSFEFIIPQVQYPFAQYPDGFQTANIYIDKLKALKVNKKPFKFNIFRTMPGEKVLFDYSVNVSLEAYTLTEAAGDGFDITANVTLKTYEEHSTIIYQNKTNALGGKAIKAESARADSKQFPTAYTVKKGDNLWTICKTQLGDGSKFGEVAKLNGITNPKLIYPGQVIKFAK